MHWNKGERVQYCLKNSITNSLDLEDIFINAFIIEWNRSLSSYDICIYNNEKMDIVHELEYAHVNKVVWERIKQRT